MKRPSLVEAIVFAGLLISGALLRLQIDVPNFAPVAAISLFAGFYFRSWMVAAALPVAIMLVSDYWLGGYSSQMMLLVYAALVVPIACRSWIRSQFGRASEQSTAKSVVGLLGSSFCSSCFFFLVTNFGAWVWFDMYDHTAAGLLQCYAAALPFFRYTLAGDMFFAVVLFGGYTWAWSAGLLPTTRPRDCLST